MRWLSALASWFGKGSTPAAEADEEEGRWARPAGWSDVLHLADLLQAEAVEYVLVGGYALNYNGVIRQTTDVDILVRDTPENNVRWVRALSRLPDGAAREIDLAEGNPFEKYATDYEGEADGNGVIKVADEFVVDVMQRACGKSYEDVVDHVMVSTKGNRNLRVLDLEGLRMLKQGVRDKDRDDLRRIEAAIAALGPEMRLHQEAMGAREFEAERPPAAGEKAFRVLPPADDARIALARDATARLAAAGVEIPWDADSLAVYCDAEEIARIQWEVDPASYLDELMAGKGVMRP
jgi:predicted nucleotidyltransferase